MIIIIILLLIVILPITMLKLLGMRAEKLVGFEISGLTRDQIIDIGTKASESPFRRLRGRAKVFALNDEAGSVAWNAKCNGGYMTFIVTPLPDDSGFLVGARSMGPRLIQMYGVADLNTDYGRTKFWLYYLMWKLGIPHNPRALLYRRWKGLNAIKRKGTLIQRTPVEASQSGAASVPPGA